MPSSPAPARQLDPERAGDHVDRLYRVARALTGSPHDAEDLVQETYARVLSRPRMIKSERLDANRTVAVERLVDELWGDDPPETAVKMVQIHVSQLRKGRLVLARGLGARSLELRAAVTLGRLWRDGGRSAQARGVVAAAYASFTEGFDTPDLRAAAELLGRGEAVAAKG